MENQTILIVDDEAILLKSIAKDLEQEKFSVTTAASGEEAIILLKDNQFDLVVTDMVMSGLDGIQVLNETKKINSLTGVIILTGHGDMTTAIDALRLGADDYILKPCDPDELITRIDHCLKKLDAMQKVKFYENILPVCIYCKDIRDDAKVEPGKGKWLKLEEYIHTKSGTDISHDCCPDCYEKHKDD